MLNIDDKEWRDYFIEEVAAINSGRDIYEDERTSGDTPYISSSSANNGICHFVSNSNETLEADCISVNRNGSVGYAFYHAYKALYSNDCRKLRLEKPNKYIAIFIATQITAQRGKYSYGYKMGTGRLKRQKIMLPSNEQGNPDYDFMEQYIKEREQQIMQNYIDYIGESIQNQGALSPLSEKTWATFSIGDLFELVPGKGKGVNHLEKNPTGISYLGATNRNNGVLEFVSPVSDLIQAGNCIAFIRNGEGSMGFAVYKQEDFIASADITVGYSPFINKYTGFFITTVADKVRGKYNFNYKRSDTRLKKELLQLPVNESRQPDWAYMEAYTKKKFNEIRLHYLQLKVGVQD